MHEDIRRLVLHTISIALDLARLKVILLFQSVTIWVLLWLLLIYL